MSKPRPRTKYEARAERKKQARKETSAAKRSDYRARRAAAWSPPRFTKKELGPLDDAIHRYEEIAHESIIRAREIFRVGHKLLRRKPGQSGVKEVYSNVDLDRIGQWLKQRYPKLSFGRTWIRRHLTIGNGTISPQQVKDKEIADLSLEVIAGVTDASQRAILLDHGSGKRTKDFKAALRHADRFEAPEERLLKLKKAITGQVEGLLGSPRGDEDPDDEDLGAPRPRGLPPVLPHRADRSARLVSGLLQGSLAGLRHLRLQVGDGQHLSADVLRELKDTLSQAAQELKIEDVLAGGDAQQDPGPRDRRGTPRPSRDQEDPSSVEKPHLGPAERALPVPFPAGHRSPNPSDLHAASLIVAFAQACDEALAIDFYRDYPYKLHLDAPLRLHYLLWQAACGFFEHFTALEPALREAEERGRTFLERMLPSYPGSSLEDMFPVTTDWQEGDQAMAWVVWHELDPTHTRQPNELHRPMVRLLGLYRAIDRSFDALYKAINDGHAISLDLPYQLLVALREMFSRSGFVQGEFCKGGREFEAQLAEHAKTAELRAAFRAEQESRILMLGADRISAQYAVIGVLPDGTPVAIDLNTAQVVAMLGGQGWGKSQVPPPEGAA